MSNMSYCRFQNTSTDLHVCKDVLEELHYGDDEAEPLSAEEAAAARRLVQMCLDIAAMYPEGFNTEKEQA